MIIAALSSLFVLGLIAIVNQESTSVAPALQPVRHTTYRQPNRQR